MNQNDDFASMEGMSEARATKRQGKTTRTSAEARSGTRRGKRAVAAPDVELAELAANRVAIEGVSPDIDGGRFPAKAVAGAPFVVEADIFCDGHDKIDAALLIRREDETDWREVPMAFFDNDRWRGVAVPEDNARYLYTIIAWRDLFASWRDEVSKKHAAGVDVSLELIEGRNLVEQARKEGDRADAEDRKRLDDLARRGSTRPIVRPNGSRLLLSERRRRSDEARRAADQPLPLSPRAEAGRRPPAGRLQRLVRAVPALDVG